MQKYSDFKNCAEKQDEYVYIQKHWSAQTDRRRRSTFSNILSDTQAIKWTTATAQQRNKPRRQAKNRVIATDVTEEKHAASYPGRRRLNATKSISLSYECMLSKKRSAAKTEQHNNSKNVLTDSYIWLQQQRRFTLGTMTIKKISPHFKSSHRNHIVVVGTTNTYLRVHDIKQAFHCKDKATHSCEKFLILTYTIAEE